MRNLPEALQFLIQFTCNCFRHSNEKSTKSLIDRASHRPQKDPDFQIKKFGI